MYLHIENWNENWDVTQSIDFAHIIVICLTGPFDGQL